ncbi:hypothetical protein [Streptomyces sp. NPDC001274]
MTATEFRTQHGDPTTWTNHDFTVYQDLAAAETPTENTPDPTPPTTT